MNKDSPSRSSSSSARESFEIVDDEDEDFRSGDMDSLLSDFLWLLVFVAVCVEVT